MLLSPILWQRSSFCSAVWLQSFAIKPYQDVSWVPAKGREMVFKVFLAVLGRGELLVIVSYLLVRNQLLSGAGGERWGSGWSLTWYCTAHAPVFTRKGVVVNIVLSWSRVSESWYKQLLQWPSEDCSLSQPFTLHYQISYFTLNLGHRNCHVKANLD